MYGEKKTGPNNFSTEHIFEKIPKHIDSFYKIGYDKQIRTLVRLNGGKDG